MEIPPNILNYQEIKFINKAEPKVMHVDLNACFAIIEQQANPLLRGKPIAVAAYASDYGCVLAPSYEAKRFGVKVGMRVIDAKKLCPGIIVLEPDPAKYRDAHTRFRKIFEDYTPHVYPRSIDEAILDFNGLDHFNYDLVKIGHEIKRRIKNDIGEWVTCNVGISTNRFLAKTAASLHKPDGLDVITHENLFDVFKSLKLVDLYGINTKYEARLNANGIFSVLEFYNASEQELMKGTFKSINGYYWYLRLRGWEIDSVEFDRKSFGHSYSLQKKTDEPRELARLLMKLCEKMGRRLRHSGHVAYGVNLYFLYTDGTHWHKGKKFNSKLYSTSDLFKKAIWISNQQPQKKVVRNIAVSCFELKKNNTIQYSLFDAGEEKEKKLSDAADDLNDLFGEFTVVPALMMGMKEKTILDRIAFGNVKELR